jgi:hypothetical protein
MKKIFLILTTCAIALTSVKAQVAKGNLFVGADLGATSYRFGTYTYNYPDANVKTEDQNDYSLNLSPRLGVFLSDHLIFGGALALDYNHDKINNSNTTDNLLMNNTVSNQTTFSVGPFVRYYFFGDSPGANLFYIQADVDVGSGSGSTKASTLSTANVSGSSTENINGVFAFKAGGTLGFTHFIQKNIGLDLGIGYLYDYESYSSTLTSETGTPGSTSASYKAKIPQNDIFLSAGFHFFVK